MAKMGKVSTALIMGADYENMKAPEEGVTELYTVIGSAHSMRTGQTNYGTFYSFFGTFQAVRSDSGEVFTGDELFLPGIAEMRVKAAMDANPGGVIKFGYRIGLKKPTKAGQKYEYVVENLLAELSGDPLSNLRATLKLPAPGAPKAVAPPTKRA